MIERRHDAVDARARRLAPTAAGVERMLGAVVDVEAADRAFFAPVASRGVDLPAFLRKLARRDADGRRTDV